MDLNNNYLLLRKLRSREINFLIKAFILLVLIIALFYVGSLNSLNVSSNQDDSQIIPTHFDDGSIVI